MQSTKDPRETGVLEIAGKSYPFRISFRVLRNFQMRSGLSFIQMADVDLNGLAILIHEGMKAGAKMVGAEPLTEEQILDLLDEDMGAIIRASEILAKEMEALYPEEGKKKAKQGNS